MSIPKYDECCKPILQFLSDGQCRTVKDVKAEIAKHFCLTEEEINEMLPSGRQTVFANRVGWARTYLKKAGLVESPSKAVMRITDEGKRTLKENPQIVDRTYMMKYESFRKFVKAANKPVETIKDDQNDVTPDDTLESSFEKINDNLADELLSEVMKLSPIAFEKMVLDLMGKMGYGTFANSAKMTAATGDEGIDGIIMEDKLGFNLIYIQVKHWNEDHLVGRPDVQAFVGAIAGKGGKGLFVTTSKFTKQAIDYAKHQHVVLMDGDKLAHYMIEHNFGVSTKKVFEVKAVDTDVFDEYQDM